MLLSACRERGSVVEKQEDWKRNGDAEEKREEKQDRRDPVFTRSKSFIAFGTVLALGGVLIILAFGLADRTGDLMAFIAKNESFRVFLIIIGALVGIVGFLVARFGSMGADNLLRLRQSQMKGATYDEVFKGTRRSQDWRR